MKLNEDIVPTNLEEALILLKEALSPIEKKEIMKLGRVSLHKTLGKFIRNEWSLWNEWNVMTVWFDKTYGIKHADDVSGIIMECLINDLQGQPRRDQVVAKEFRDHWENLKKK